MLLLGGCLLVGSCGFLGKLVGSSGGGPKEGEGRTAEEGVAAASTQLIGEVASVHTAEGFVLIKRFGGGSLPEGFVFHSQGAGGETASLRPTGEKLGRFYAADITGGTPQAGDFVMGRRLPEAAESPSVPTLEPPKAGSGLP